MSVAHAKTYEFLNPEGVLTTITNLQSFCELNDLNAGNMFSVHKGRMRQHKGWKKP